MTKAISVAVLLACACSKAPAVDSRPPPPPEHVGEYPIYAPDGREVWTWMRDSRSPKYETGKRVLFITKAGQAAGVECVKE